MIIAFNKPYGVLSQFTQAQPGGSTKEMPGHRTLAEFGFPKNVYPIGRLDRDSEGLLLLSDEKKWNDLLLNPRNAHKRTYHAQVEGVATQSAVEKLEKGLALDSLKTKPCAARLIQDPGYPEREVPIRFRLSVPTSWIEIELIEGKNRQVRRMTAAVGFPTLRLIRVAIGKYKLGDLKSGKWLELKEKQRHLLLS